MLGRILSIEDADVHQARFLAQQHPGLSARDVIHLAVMKRHGVMEILTADTAFDKIEQVRRIDPARFSPER